jgi:hypothetical protein
LIAEAVGSPSNIDDKDSEDVLVGVAIDGGLTGGGPSVGRAVSGIDIAACS